mmetsp:Transcript_22605/g.60076  ORF Transcript_22605/g.60076 Transcript_22605/m.60076 type:complete len:226 (+) Transcript_22605:320-997(+)
MVTDHRAGKKYSQISAGPRGPYVDSDNKKLFKSWMTPLAVLLNRLWYHGFDVTLNLSQPHKHLRLKAIFDVKDRLRDSVTSMDWRPPVRECFTLIFQQRSEELELLRSDMVEQTLPRIMWNAVVETLVINEWRHHDMYVLLLQVLIISADMDVLLQEPQLEKADILKKLLGRTALAESLITIGKGLNELILFMHSPERRKCECLAYVAAASEIGVLRTRPPKYSE